VKSILRKYIKISAELLDLATCNLKTLTGVVGTKGLSKYRKWEVLKGTE
jgi:hypothetical protein